MKSIARNKKLHAFATAQIGTDNSTLGCPIGVQRQNLNWIAQIIVIKLVVADTVQAHWCVRRYHEVKSGTGWTSFGEWWWQCTRCNALFTHESHAHESACGVGFKFEERANLIGGHLVYHWFRLNIEERTPNVQSQNGQRSQISK